MIRDAVTVIIFVEVIRHAIAVRVHHFPRFDRRSHRRLLVVRDAVAIVIVVEVIRDAAAIRVVHQSIAGRGPPLPPWPSPCRRLFAGRMLVRHAAAAAAVRVRSFIRTMLARPIGVPWHPCASSTPPRHATQLSTQLNSKKECTHPNRETSAMQRISVSLSRRAFVGACTRVRTQTRARMCCAVPRRARTGQHELTGSGATAAARTGRDATPDACRCVQALVHTCVP